MKSNLFYLAISSVLLILIGCSFCALIMGYVLVQSNNTGSIIKFETQTPKQVQQTSNPEEDNLVATQNTKSILTIDQENPLPNPAAENTLNTLQQTNVPEKNLYDLISRYKNKTISPGVERLPPKKYHLGDQRKFWVLDTLVNSYNRINAVLYFETPHLYFWVAADIPVDKVAIANLSNAFEDKIYPVDRKFFGSELTPGIDDDPHLYLLYTHGLGNAAGSCSCDTSFE